MCVDKWMMENRKCNMCKMDIIKNYGFVFDGRKESIMNMEVEDEEEEDVNNENERMKKRSRNYV
jgi:hypothetical protein